MNRAKAILEKDIDWAYFAEIAPRCGIQLLIYNSLNKVSSPDAIPRYIFDNLKKGYIAAVPKATLQYNETLEFLKLFSEKNIPVLPLKGPVLSKRLYGDIAARSVSCDIDLFVKEEDKARARQILEKEGYASLDGYCKKFSKDFLGQIVFTKPGAIMVDLHWKINPVPLKPGVMKEFWEGVRLEREGAVNYYELNEEELLIQLSVHFVNSVRFSQLRHACDIHHLLAKFGDTLNWAGLTGKARKWKLSNSLYAALIFSKTLFQSHVPDEALASLRPGFPKRLLIKALAKPDTVLMAGSKERRFIDTFLKHILFDIVEAESLRDFFAILFPPKGNIGGKPYFKRLAGGTAKLIKWAIAK